MKKALQFTTAIAILAGFAFAANPAHEEPKKIQIVIDAGHGGNDSGAKFEDVTEKAIVSEISKKITELNRNANIAITLTRATDATVTLKERTDVINALQPDVVISLHVGASADPEKSGVSLYIAKENDNKQRARELAQKLGRRIEKNLGLSVGEVQEAPLYILKNSQAPGIIVELGYLTNDHDRKFLTDEKKQQRIARTLLECVNDLAK